MENVRATSLEAHEGQGWGFGLGLATDRLGRKGVPLAMLSPRGNTCDSDPRLKMADLLEYSPRPPASCTFALQLSYTVSRPRPADARSSPAKNLHAALRGLSGHTPDDHTRCSIDDRRPENRSPIVDRHRYPKTQVDHVAPTSGNEPVPLENAS